MADDLKQCPFCGAEVKLTWRWGYRSGKKAKLYFVEARKHSCWCCCRGPENPDEKEVVGRWNTRKE